MVLTNEQEKLLKARTASYRDYKRFGNEKFRESLITYFSAGKIISYDAFENLILQTLDKVAPIRQKHIRDNQYPFLNKDIHKAIMTRTRLKNRFLKEPTPINRLSHKKPRNYCVSLMRENKKQYYGSLNANHIMDNEKFWREVEPNFSNKIVDINRVILRDNGKITSDTERVV